jgi:tRNA-Thr(GGU) m(6)t(6)A37 methyltransferase TsaA
MSNNLMTHHDFQLRQIGIVRSALKDVRECPRQESENAPGAWIEIEPEYSEALEGLEVGDEILIMTWMHLADRSRLKVHPRGDPKNPIKGVFGTRSPHRPNPIGLHRTRVLSVDPPCRLQVQRLAVIDNTPIVDIKSVLSGGR